MANCEIEILYERIVSPPGSLRQRVLKKNFREKYFELQQDSFVEERLEEDGDALNKGFIFEETHEDEEKTLGGRLSGVFGFPMALCLLACAFYRVRAMLALLERGAYLSIPLEFSIALAGIYWALYAGIVSYSNLTNRDVRSDQRRWFLKSALATVSLAVSLAASILVHALLKILLHLKMGHTPPSVYPIEAYFTAANDLLYSALLSLVIMSLVLLVYLFSLKIRPTVLAILGECIQFAVNYLLFGVLLLFVLQLRGEVGFSVEPVTVFPIYFVPHIQLVHNMFRQFSTIRDSDL